MVCGGRDFANIPKSKADPNYANRVSEYNFIQSTLDRLAIKHSKYYNPVDDWLPWDIYIINGAARGADSASTDWAVTNYAKFKEYEADWNRHKKAAGAIRNQLMLDSERPIDLVVAFPGNKGTADMVRRARKEGIEVYEVKYNPSMVN